MQSITINDNINKQLILFKFRLKEQHIYNNIDSCLFQRPFFFILKQKSWCISQPILSLLHCETKFWAMNYILQMVKDWVRDSVLLG